MHTTMILMIDNYDSFTYNLVHYFQALKQTVQVFRHDAITINDISLLNPDYIVISPGPGRPEEAGITLPCIETFAGKIPLLGVCLGHQAIAHAFGAKIINAQKILHGKTSDIYHTNSGVFYDLPSPFRATRYHSLVIDGTTLPKEFEITARTTDNEIMGIKHQTLALEGVQFHPEAILTAHGMQLLNNFIANNKRE